MDDTNRVKENRTLTILLRYVVLNYYSGSNEMSECLQIKCLYIMACILANIYTSGGYGRLTVRCDAMQCNQLDGAQLLDLLVIVFNILVVCFVRQLFIIIDSQVFQVLVICIILIVEIFVVNVLVLVV